MSTGMVERGDEVVVRRADASLTGVLVELVESAYRGEVSRGGWTTEADLLEGQRIDETMMGAALADPDVAILVALDRGRPVGCCEVRRPSDGVADFGMFAVSPSHQAVGIGRRLLGAAERFAVTEWDATHLQLSVIEQRPELIDWYRRRGYEPTGEHRPFPYGDPRFGRPLRDDLRFLVLSRSVP